MKIVDYIKGLLRKSKEVDEAPEGYCPNCWGEQEYDGEVREVLMKKNIDLNNVEDELGWIEAYFIENFEGIKVKKEKGKKVCPSCEKEH